MAHTHVLVALYDATPELDMYVEADLPQAARALGKEFAIAHLGAIGRVGEPVVQTVLESVYANDSFAVALSPAASRYEHEKGFRLPQLSAPIVYTGRGALGADVAVLESSEAVCIIGADAEALEGVLGCIGKATLPIAIFTHEQAARVGELVRMRYPHLLNHVKIFAEPQALVQDLVMRLRTHMRPL
jgi:hypothetical protein